MKEATRMGGTLKTIGDEKEAVNNGEESYFGLFHWGSKHMHVMWYASCDW